MPVTIALTTEEKVLLTLSPQTPNGNPAPVDGEPVWSVTAGDVTLDVQPGGLSCYVLSGAAGTSEVTVTAVFGCTVRVVVWMPPFNAAVTITDRLVETVPAVAVKEALAAPLGTVIEVGTVSAVLLSETAMV